MMSLEDAKSSIKYYKLAHPNHYKELGGDKITDEKIEEALDIVSAVIGGFGDMSEDMLFKRELTRICNDTPRD